MALGSVLCAGNTAVKERDVDWAVQPTTDQVYCVFTLESGGQDGVVRRALEDLSSGPGSSWADLVTWQYHSFHT
jgi:hypothetical protein